jgi:hypothetical protein
MPISEEDRTDAGIHYETVKRILHEYLNMRKLNSQLVPHELNSFQKAVRAQVSRELLDFLETHRTEVCQMRTLEMKRGCT